MDKTNYASLAEVYNHLPWCRAVALVPLQFSPHKCNCGSVELEQATGLVPMLLGSISRDCVRSGRELLTC
jgi:hypothetical protein